MEVLVEFDYTAEEPDELTIKKGDIIKDVSQFEEGWYIGNLNGKVGVFPDNFVKTLDTKDNQKKQNIPIVETVKEPKQETKRAPESDVDKVRIGAAAKPQRATGIGLGNIFSGQPIQLKQTSLKEVMKDNESSTEKVSRSAKGDCSHSPFTTDHVRARFDYEPKQPDELELHVDDLIQVLERNLPDEGWWKGRNLTTMKTGVFPDNFVTPVTSLMEPSVNGTQALSVNANTSPDAPKLSAKPNSFMGTAANHMGGKSISLTNARPQHEGPKATNVTNERTTLTSAATSVSVVTSPATTSNANAPVHLATPGSGRTGRWRTSSEHSDAQKSRTDDAHAGSSGDLLYAEETVDETSQRLGALTADRPRQAGRRLPSKFNSSASPSNETINRNDLETGKRTIPSSSNLAMTHSTSTKEEDLGRAVGTELTRVEQTRGMESDHRSQRQNTATINKTGLFHRKEGEHGPSDMNRSQENLTTKSTTTDGTKSNNLKIQSILEQLQNEHEQHVNEYKQQIRDLRKQVEQLKESNRQLRSDMLQSQRVVTERVQALMNEVDEARKQRASDAVELARLRSIMMQLDAKAIITTANGRPPSAIQSRHSTDCAIDDRQNNSRGTDAQSMYDEDDTSEQEKIQTVVDNNMQPRTDAHNFTTESGKTFFARNSTANRIRLGTPISMTRETR